MNVCKICNIYFNLKEEGVYLALDLGGTNFRAILLELHQGNIVREIVKLYEISTEQRVGCGIALFDYMATCLVQFVTEQGLEDVPLPLGFTFSFPMKQHSLNSGYLVTWTKTFNCPGVVGENVVELLRTSLQRCGHNHIDVLAILNDTTGTLVRINKYLYYITVRCVIYGCVDPNICFFLFLIFYCIIIYNNVYT